MAILMIANGVLTALTLVGIVIAWLGMVFGLGAGIMGATAPLQAE